MSAADDLQRFNTRERLLTLLSPAFKATGFPVEQLDAVVDELISWSEVRCREAELAGILKGRKAEVEFITGVAQADDQLAPDEYEAMLLVLGKRGQELKEPDYPRNATWLA